MMDFITPYCKKNKAIVLIILWLSCTWVQAAEISYRVVSIVEEDGYIVLHLLQKYQLSKTMLEALDNGVPLTFHTYFDLEEEDVLWFPFHLEKKIKRQILYHPLSEEYEIIDLNEDKKRRFATREAAILALGELKAIRVVPVKRLQKGIYYQVKIKTEHDISSLPLALRPLAYLSPSWHLSSKVYKWRLKL